MTQDEFFEMERCGNCRVGFWPEFFSQLDPPRPDACPNPECDYGHRHNDIHFLRRATEERFDYRKGFGTLGGVSIYWWERA